MKTKNIYIIGSGPAGSATALSIAKLATTRQTSFSVVLVCGPKNHHHAIGETIPPAATEYLRKLGVADLLNEQQHIYCPGSISIWGQEQPGFNDFFYTPVGKGYHLDRDTFNQSLMLAAESSGARLMRDTKLSSIEQVEGSKQLKLTLETANNTIMEYADFVIDAKAYKRR